MLLKVRKGKLSVLSVQCARGTSCFSWFLPCGNGHTSGTSSSKTATLFCPLFVELSRSICEPDLIHWAFPSDPLFSHGSAGVAVWPMCKLGELECFLLCWCSILLNLCGRRRALAHSACSSEKAGSGDNTMLRCHLPQ